MCNLRCFFFWLPPQLKKYGISAIHLNWGTWFEIYDLLIIQLKPNLPLPTIVTLMRALKNNFYTFNFSKILSEEFASFAIIRLYNYCKGKHLPFTNYISCDHYLSLEHSVFGHLYLSLFCNSFCLTKTAIKFNQNGDFPKFGKLS